MTSHTTARRLTTGTVRRVVASTSVALSLSLGVVATSCSSDDGAESSVLDQVAPTRADIEREAGVVFPPSTSGFRLVRIGGGQIDVTFTLDDTDIDAFATGTGLTLTAGDRAITHASPLWDVAVTGEVAGGSSTEDGVTRTAEVVTGTDGTSTVRMSLVQS